MAEFRIIATGVDSNTPIPEASVRAMEVAKARNRSGKDNPAIVWINRAVIPLLTFKGMPTRLLSMWGNLEFCNAAIFHADKAKNAYCNLDLLILKTCISVFDQSTEMNVNIAGIHCCSLLILYWNNVQNLQYRGFTMDKMLHMRAILYSCYCAIFK